MTTVLLNYGYNEMTRALLATAPGPADPLGGVDMSDRTCAVEGCGKRVHSHGFCSSHSHRFVRHGDPLAGGVGRQPQGGPCAVEGCEEPTKTKGWCGAHYQRWHKTGDPLGIRPARWDGYERPDCTVGGCGQPAHAQGLCSIHSPRARRHGDPTAGRRLEATGTPEERYWSFVDRGASDECWPWNGGLYATGYGQFTIDGRTDYAHRWGYERLIGPIPVGLVIDHRCHNEDVNCPGGRTCRHRRCENPAHWEPVTNVENMRRGRARSNEGLL